MIGLREQDVQALRERAFELHCPRIQLEQRRIDAPRTYRGAGRIHQDSSGALRLTVYAEAAGGPVGDEALAAGQVIPDHIYFRLSATDQLGREWTCSHVLVREHFASVGCVVHAAIDFLEMEGPPPRAPESARFIGYVSQALRLPPNARTMETHDLGAFSRSSSRQGRSAFVAAGARFEVFVEGEFTRVYADTGQAEMPPRFAERVRSTLEFTCGALVPWLAYQETTPTLRRAHVRGRPYTPQVPRIQPPIRSDLPELAEAVYRLFDCHLRHLLTRPEAPIHLLTAEWGEVLRGSVATLETQATITCAVGESLCRYLQQAGLARVRQRKGGRGWGRYRRRLRSWREAVLGCSRSLRLPHGILRRLEAAFTPVGFVSASRVLDRLEKGGAIDGHLAATWRRLRPAAAHADREGLGSMDQLNADCYAVQALLYQLMFRIVGYAGPVTDFTAPDWPPTNYPPGHQRSGGTLDLTPRT